MTTSVLIWLVCSVHALVAVNLTNHVNWYLLEHEKCGESASDRIIGGQHAQLGQFPWMAKLGYIKPYKGNFEVLPRGFKCGGSLINPVYVLTAAHCVTGLNGEVLALVRLGEHDTRTNVDCEFDKCAPPVQDFTPAEVVVHKKYSKPASMRNDIALVRLDRPAQIHNYVYPICLPYSTVEAKNYIGRRMEVAGWGVNDMSLGTTSDTLLVVRVPMIDHSFCKERLREYASVGKGQICAGAVVGYDSCGGDSGGPLMSPAATPDTLPRYFIMGIVSFGSTKCGSDLPAVYTDVGHYMTWILDNIEP